jgi:hypothetical protein
MTAPTNPQQPEPLKVANSPGLGQQPEDDELQTLRDDFERYLELGINPLFKKLNIPNDKDTERLYATIIEANMLSVTRLLEEADRRADKRVEEARKAECKRVFEGTSKAIHDTYFSVLNGIADGLESELPTVASKIRMIADKARKEMLDDIVADATHNPKGGSNVPTN